MATRRGLWTGIRALIAVALLLGFYVFTITIVGAAITLGVFATQANALAAIKVWFLIAAVVVPTVRFVFFSRSKESVEPHGLQLTRDAQPELWQLLDRIAVEADVRGPDQVMLTADVNAGVAERSRLLGLIGGPRHLEVGVSLFFGLTRAQLTSVLAHEFGHYANRDLRLAAVTRAGRVALSRTAAGFHARADERDDKKIAKLRAKSDRRVRKGRKALELDAGTGIDRVLARTFGAYMRLYLRVSESVGRRQELGADRIAAQLAGRDAAVSALRAIPALEAAQRCYEHVYLPIGVPAKMLPPRGEVFGGLWHLLSDPTRRKQLAEVAAESATDESSDPFDTHPSAAARIAAIQALPADGRVDDSTPAVALLRDVPGLLAGLEDAVLSPGIKGYRRAEWDELAAHGHALVLAEQLAPVTNALGLLGFYATASGLLDAMDAGKAWEVAARISTSESVTTTSGRAARELLRPDLASAAIALVARDLVASGRARWRVSWAEGVVLDIHGSSIDELDAAVAAACADPASGSPLRSLLPAAPVLPQITV